MSAELISRQAAVFMGCAEAGSFTKAGELLHLSPNAVRAQVLLLEDRLGLTLCVKTRRGLTLTPAGESLFSSLKRLSADSAQAVRDARQAALSELTLNIGTSLMVPGQQAVLLWQRLKPKLGALEVRLVPFDNNEAEAAYILRHLGEGIDLVPGLYDEPFLKRFNCAALPLEPARLCLAVPEGHPLSLRQELQAAELASALDGVCVEYYGPGAQTLFDAGRDFLTQHAPRCCLKAVPFYSLDSFSEAYLKQHLVLSIGQWDACHPLFHPLRLKDAPQGIFGLIHAQKPRPAAAAFLKAVKADLARAQVRS